MERIACIVLSNEAGHANDNDLRVKTTLYLFRGPPNRGAQSLAPPRRRSVVDSLSCDASLSALPLYNSPLRRCLRHSHENWRNRERSLSNPPPPSSFWPRYCHSERKQDPSRTPRQYLCLYSLCCCLWNHGYIWKRQ